MSRAIDLVIADVDGTLVTNDKVLTDEAKRAVADLRRAGIKFAVTSGRPPRGMAMLIEPLAIDTPVAGFNGGALMKPDLETAIDAHDLPEEVVGEAIGLLDASGLDAWVYTSRHWLVRDLSAPHVEREAHTVQFQPDRVAGFDISTLGKVVKIVGVSDDRDAMQRALQAAEEKFGGHVSAACSQPYYLDITNARANKGEVVASLCRLLNVDPTRVATLGDMPNDIAMFRRSGMSIAMGHSEAAVQSQATFVTTSNEEEGFAKAIRRHILDGIGA